MPTFITLLESHTKYYIQINSQESKEIQEDYVTPPLLIPCYISPKAFRGCHSLSQGYSTSLYTQPTSDTHVINQELF